MRNLFVNSIPSEANTLCTDKKTDNTDSKQSSWNITISLQQQKIKTAQVVFPLLAMTTDTLPNDVKFRRLSTMKTKTKIHKQPFKQHIFYLSFNTTIYKPTERAFATQNDHSTTSSDLSEFVLFEMLLPSFLFASPILPISMMVRSVHKQMFWENNNKKKWQEKSHIVFIGRGGRSVRKLKMLQRWNRIRRIAHWSKWLDVLFIDV